MPLPWWVYAACVAVWVVAPLMWRLLGPLARAVRADPPAVPRVCWAGIAAMWALTALQAFLVWRY